MIGTELTLAVLVFTKTAVHTGGAVAYRHEAIPSGIRAIEEMGKERGWQVSFTEDARSFNDESLARFDVAVFLMTTGDVLDPDQEAAFERFIKNGKGYVGIHSASDTEYEWPFYESLVGAYFRSHPEIQQATYSVEDREHPATRHLPSSWVRTDEQYSFRTNPRDKVQVLISLDEKSYEAGEHGMGDHPVVWCQELEGGGRSFYTSLGHTKESYSDPLYRELIASAIAWSAKR
jgi:cytochrome c